MNTTKILATIGGTLIIVCVVILTFTYSTHMFTASASAPNIAPIPAPTIAPTPAPTPQPAPPIIVQSAPPVIVQSAPPVIVQSAPPVIVQSAPTLDSPFSNFVARYGTPFQNPYGQTCFWYDSSQIVNICVVTNNSDLVTWIQAGDNDLNITGADTDQKIANFITNQNINQYIPTDGTTYTITADGLDSTTMTH